MASVPTPKSFNQILGDALDALTSRLGIPKLPPGDPILSILEATSQSDFRTSQDIFQLLNSIVLDRATGLALDRIAADEDLARYSESPATGTVTISDTSFEKKQSTIFQGLSAPAVGSTTINVVSALGWPGTGNIYIGRGTTEYEGPIPYSSIVDNGTYWTINLTTNTTKYHNLGSGVVLAQGGNRQIASGTVVQTPQGNAGTAVQFTVQYTAVIPDGETEITSVQVVAKKPGVIGNASANSVNSFTSAPFTGAAVNNTTPYTNGRATEEDNTFRERIRTARQSKQKGIALAIKSGVIGAVATDENRRILSSSLVAREGYPTTLYIDDGSGYEEKTQGTPFEVIVDSALGGERYFDLAEGRPVTKAFATTSLSAPFILQPNAQLAVKVGGKTYIHSFTSTSFRSIDSATAYEVAASINSNPALGFNARTIENGKRVSLFAVADTGEDIEVVAPVQGSIDANIYLGFPTGANNTLRLYKNDVLLSKDGSIASIASNPQSAWGSTSDGETLSIVVDGTPAFTVTINDSDFVNAGTPYNTVVSTNSTDSWAKVLNYLIPGVTATANSGIVTITSNLGKTSRASVEILAGSSLVSNGLFNVSVSQGSDSDYTLNRNRGQIRLEEALSVGDRLTAGSYDTRAFIESDSIGTINLGSNANLWFSVDGNARIIPTGLLTGSALVITSSVTAYGKRVRATASTSVFDSVNVLDWIIIDDPALSANAGAFKIVRKSSTWIEWERESAFAGTGSFTLSAGGFTVARTTDQIQKVTIPSGTNYTALTLVAAINNSILGAKASVYRTTKIRVQTNSFASGSIALLSADAAGKQLLLPIASAVVNVDSHLASVVGNPQAGTPSFENTLKASSTTGPDNFDSATLGTINEGQLIVADKPVSDGIGRDSNRTHVSAIEDIATNTISLRTPVLNSWLTDDAVYHARPFALNPTDTFGLIIDSEQITHRYNLNLWRKVKATTNVYGLTNDFTDADNGNASLASAFGLDFDFTDFAAYMKARVRTHVVGGLNTDRTILYKYARFGPEGELARLQYRYPSQPSKAVALTTETTSSDNVNIVINLPSGAARTGHTMRPSSKVGFNTLAAPVAGLYTYTVTLSLDLTQIQRTVINVATATVALPAGITDHGLNIGNRIYLVSTDGAFPSGLKLITARPPAPATTFDYVDSGPIVGASPNAGSVSFDSVGEVTLNGSTVIVGDIFGQHNLNTGTGGGSRISAIAGNNRSFNITSDFAAAVNTTINWTPIGSAGFSYSFFPINAATATGLAIASAVNAMNASVTATNLGAGLSVIDYATYEPAPNGEGALTPWYTLSDGLNWIKSQTNPLLVANNYTFDFKKSITAGLGTDSNWSTEDVRLVPTTAKNIVDFLNSTATSGLRSVAMAELTDNGQRPQISSLKIGSSGSVAVNGGSGNSYFATAKTSAVATNSNARCIVSFDTSDTQGLSANQWVVLQNSTAVPKTRLSATTTFNSIDTSGNVVLSVTRAWDWANTAAASVTGDWEVIKNGNFVQMRATSGTPAVGVKEGDFAIINITSGSTSNEFLSGVRIVRVSADGKVFWIESPNATEEIATATIHFVTYDSVVPGDVLSINSSILGVGNVGQWVVESIDLTDRFRFKLATGTVAPVALVVPVTLNSEAGLVHVIERAPSKLFKQIRTIFPNSATMSTVKFTTSEGYSKIGPFAGTILQSLDKLNFSTTPAFGSDAYTHNTGLIAECNAIVYGKESDPSTYPGLAAAGVNINITGPLIKKIQVSLAIRASINTQSVIDRVKSEVAAVINNTAIGAPIAISSLVQAAQSVNGVTAVTVLSPLYGSGSDLISVQPFEKPLVLDVDSDVLVSLVG